MAPTLSRYLLAVPFVNVLAGLAEPGQGEQPLDCLVDHLIMAANRLARVGARVLLEPLNELDVPGYCVGSFTTALAVLNRTGRAVGLQFDIYHAARMGLDPVLTYLECQPHVRHIQFADCPGRQEPGTGAIAFDALFQRIEASGYEGWLAAEHYASPAFTGVRAVP